MTPRPLAPVIPSSAVPAARQRAGSAARRRLPLAEPAPVPPPRTSPRTIRTGIRIRTSRTKSGTSGTIPTGEGAGAPAPGEPGSDRSRGRSRRRA